MDSIKQYALFMLEYPLFWIPMIFIVMCSFLLPVKIGLIFARTPITWKRSWGVYFGGAIIGGMFTLTSVMILNVLGVAQESIVYLFLGIIISLIFPYIGLLLIGKIRLSIGKYVLYLAGYFLVSIMVVSAIYGIRSVASVFKVNGNAMLPTYQDGQMIMVSKLNTSYNRGDIVVVTPNGDKRFQFYIKRIIALSGDTIRFQDGFAFIKKKNETEFQKIDEIYLSPENNGQTWLPESIERSDFIIPEDSYWLMGDNRQNSSDSRNCFKFCDGENGNTHFLRTTDIVGKIYH